MDETAKTLKAEGVKFFIGVVDRQPNEPDGGKAYTQADVNGEDMIHILDLAFPTRQDRINLGIWIGQLLNAKK